ncbi:DUF4111 domain-containing protein [Solirubrobacter taibaiensis]|nr:DUF4111 domain-containing protein [Solirubrobacter taibaiensis]
MQELEAVQALVAELDPLGVYLFGSAVHGGLQPRSDLDVFVVARRRLTTAEKQRLFEGLRTIEGRNVEVTIVADGAMEFQWGGWLPDRWEEGENHDLAILIHKVLLASRTLDGPPPQALLDPPDPEAIRHAMFDTVEPVLLDLHEDTTNVLLTLCRIYYSLVTGAIAPKGDAAAWAHARFPHIGIQRAQAIYLGGLPEDYTGIDVDYVAENLRALIAQQDRA